MRVLRAVLVALSAAAVLVAGAPRGRAREDASAVVQRLGTVPGLGPAPHAGGLFRNMDPKFHRMPMLLRLRFYLLGVVEAGLLLSRIAGGIRGPEVGVAPLCEALGFGEVAGVGDVEHAKSFPQAPPAAHRGCRTYSGQRCTALGNRAQPRTGALG